MKLLRRLCCAFVVCLSLLTAFSISVSAESVDVPEYTVTQRMQVYTDSWRSEVVGYVFNPNDDVQELTVKNWGAVGVANVPTYYYNTFTFETLNGEPLISKGTEIDTRIFDVFFGSFITYNGKYSYRYYVNTVQLIAFYADGTTEYIDVSAQQNGNNNNDFYAILPGDKDIKKIELGVTHGWHTDVNFEISGYFGEHNDAKFRLVLDRDSEETGLLNGIIEWLKSIKSGITNVINVIGALPERIWNLMSDGLKNLFVPSDSYIVQFKDDMDSMLEQKFGAVYQVVNILSDSWDRIQDSDETNTITIPEVTIDLPEENDFTFGGYEVAIVPEQFDFFAVIIKNLIAVVCTVAFVNGLRKKYDEVMGVEQ